MYKTKRTKHDFTFFNDKKDPVLITFASVALAEKIHKTDNNVFFVFLYIELLLKRGPFRFLL